MLRIEVDEVAVIDFLADCGFLLPGDDDRHVIEKALEAAISVWSRA